MVERSGKSRWPSRDAEAPEGATTCMRCEPWMTDGVRVLTIPSNKPVHAVTMGAIVRASGLSIDEFRRLL